VHTRHKGCSQELNSIACALIMFCFSLGECALGHYST